MPCTRIWLSEPDHLNPCPAWALPRAGLRLERPPCSHTSLSPPVPTARHRRRHFRSVPETADRSRPASARRAATGGSLTSQGSGLDQQELDDPHEVTLSEATDVVEVSDEGVSFDLDGGPGWVHGACPAYLRSVGRAVPAALYSMRSRSPLARSSPSGDDRSRATMSIT